MPLELDDITGFILAGGPSKRMGIDKRWIMRGGSAFLLRASHLLQVVLGPPPVIVGDNFMIEVYNDSPIIPDKAFDKGPLGGLTAGLDRCDTPWALFVPVDMPQLMPENLQRLIDAVQPEDQAVVYRQGERLCPLPGLYARTTLDYWMNQMASDNLALRHGLKGLNVRLLDISPDDKTMKNINSPSDLSEWLKELE